MFVARIQLNLHECRRRFIVQQLKTTARHITEFELMAQAFLRAVNAQQRVHARPNMRVQTISLQVRFSCGFDCKGLVNDFARFFKRLFINASVQTLELVFVQLKFLLAQGIGLRSERIERLPHSRCIAAVQSILNALRTLGFLRFAGKHRRQNRVQRLACSHFAIPRVQDVRFAAIYIKTRLQQNFLAQPCQRRLCGCALPQFDFIAQIQGGIEHILRDELAQLPKQLQIMRAHALAVSAIELAIKLIPHGLAQRVIIQHQRCITRHARAHRRGLEQAVKPRVEGVNRNLLPRAEDAIIQPLRHGQTLTRRRLGQAALGQQGQYLLGGTIGHLAQQLSHAVAHFLRGLFGEGDG